MRKPTISAPDKGMSRGMARALFALGLLAVLLAALPRILEPWLGTPPPDKAWQVSVLDSSALAANAAKPGGNSDGAGEDYRNNRGNDNDYGRDYGNASSAKRGLALAPFDPNTVSIEALTDMGVRPGAAKSIVNYRKAGATYRQASDLRKLRGLREGEFDALAPFVRIGAASVRGYERGEGSGDASNRDGNYTRPSDAGKPYKPAAPRAPVNINTADTFELASVPGISEKRAAQIVRYRERLGGFASVSQLRGLKYLEEEHYQSLAPLLTAGGGVKKMSLRTATVEELGRHPFIGWGRAKRLKAYAAAHNTPLTIEMLREADPAMTDEEWAAMAPYVLLD